MVIPILTGPDPHSKNGALLQFLEWGSIKGQVIPWFPVRFCILSLPSLLQNCRMAQTPRASNSGLESAALIFATDAQHWYVDRESVSEKSPPLVVLRCVQGQPHPSIYLEPFWNRNGTLYRGGVAITVGSAVQSHEFSELITALSRSTSASRFAGCGGK